MDILLNPNVAYLLLAGGLFLAVLAILSPGTAILEIIALVALILAGFEIYNLANEDLINWWALLIILVGMVLFVVAVRRPGHIAILIAAIAAVVLGSVFLIHGEEWYIPAVNPILATAVGVFSGGFFWITAQKVIEAESVQPTHDLEALIGARGEAKTDIRDEGSVQVFGELWSARSDTTIPEGSRVRVVAREGFALKGEALEKPESE